jgi:hypothetical protein
MILKTYTRIFTTDLDGTLALLQKLHTGEPHLRFSFGAWQLVGIGDILLVGGTNETLAPIRGSFGPWIVTNIDETRRVLVEAGAEIISDIEPVPTGRMLYARHPDGCVVEYVEWVPDLVEQFIEMPRRAGKLSSQL